MTKSLMSGRYILIDEVGVHMCVERNLQKCRGRRGRAAFSRDPAGVWVEQMTSPCQCGLGKEEPFREK